MVKHLALETSRSGVFTARSVKGQSVLGCSLAPYDAVREHFCSENMEAEACSEEWALGTLEGIMLNPLR